MGVSQQGTSTSVELQVMPGEAIKSMEMGGGGNERLDGDATMKDYADMRRLGKAQEFRVRCLA